MEKIRIQFTLFSAFYSPLISAMSGGFLSRRPRSRVVGRAARRLRARGAEERLGACRSIRALPGFHSLNKGETPPAVHFAQINEMDGFS